VESFVAHLPAPIARPGLDNVRARLRRVVEKIEAGAVEHDFVTRQSRGKTREHAALLEHLRNTHMLPVSQLAGAAEDAPTGLSRGLKSPHKRTATRKILAAAHGMANIAAQHAEWFVDTGLSRDFVGRFRAAVGDVERVTRERDSLLRRQIQANASIQTELQKGKRLVSGLDILLQVDLKDTPELLATWRKIKRSGD
jgi:hypothetical protein